ncbi:hypothetical protein TKK_0007003 [Trichogramma kaykai]|uniref:THAP-type domain-containing protein n=1 Tax=Trichogramma kaykai TaxID=54128 RepID=A0ABD2XC86_9HYME
MENQGKVKKIKGKTCCVPDCRNKSGINSVPFYRFPTNNKLMPHKVARRNGWIQAVRINCFGGSEWEPGKCALICGKHFVGNAKSEHPKSPSYNPTLFPGAQNKKFIDPARTRERFERWVKRDIASKQTIKSSKCQNMEDSSTSTPRDSVSCDIDIAMEEKFVIPNTIDVATQINFAIPEDNTQHIFLNCSISFLNNPNKRDAEIFVSLPAAIKNEYIPNDEDCIVDENNPSSIKSFSDLQKQDGIGGFKGYHSMLKNKNSMVDLCGVSFEDFNLLLKALSAGYRCETNNNISIENKLLMFLLKINSYLTFTAIGTIFGINKNETSEIFFSIVNYLAKACKEFLTWPTQQEVRGTTPSWLKPKYSNCRVMIDTIDFKVEKPSNSDDRLRFWSLHKNGYTIKVVVGCTPGGLISFVSNSYDGRISDELVVASSGILKLIEDDDSVLVDRNFPNMDPKLMKNGKNVFVTIPLVVENDYPTKQKVKKSHVDKIPFAIDRVRQKIRSFKILDIFTTEMLPYADDIVFMCCVLVNLQQTSK